MKTVLKDKRKALITAVVFTGALIAGIPMTVLGAVYHIWALMGIGIAFVVAGFYGTPIAWTSHASKKRLSRFVSAVTEENLYTVSEIAAQLSVRESEARSLMSECFKRGYLKGYKREGDAAVPNENAAPKKRVVKVVCDRCGATYSYTETDTGCPYCGAFAEVSEK